MSNRFQCLVGESVDSSIHHQGSSSVTNTAVSDLEMETKYDPSNDQLALLKGILKSMSPNKELK